MTGQIFNNNLHTKPIQIFDVLSQTDFEKVLTEKQKYLDNYERNAVSKKLFFKYSEKEIGIFSKVCDVVVKTLNNIGLVEPKITSIDFLNHVNRNKMHFHKHWMLPTITPYENYTPPINSKSPYAVPFEYFWIAIYYPHNLYQSEYAGELIVKLNESDVGQTFKAIPNSLVLHNGHYGHEVTIPKTHPTRVRDSCFTHWVCKYNS